MEATVIPPARITGLEGVKGMQQGWRQASRQASTQVSRLEAYLEAGVRQGEALEIVAR